MTLMKRGVLAVLLTPVALTIGMWAPTDYWALSMDKAMGIVALGGARGDMSGTAMSDMMAETWALDGEATFLEKVIPHDQWAAIGVGVVFIALRSWSPPARQVCP